MWSWRLLSLALAQGYDPARRMPSQARTRRRRAQNGRPATDCPISGATAVARWPNSASSSMPWRSQVTHGGPDHPVGGAVAQLHHAAHAQHGHAPAAGARHVLRPGEVVAVAEAAALHRVGEAAEIVALGADAAAPGQDEGRIRRHAPPGALQRGEHRRAQPLFIGRAAARSGTAIAASGGTGAKALAEMRPGQTDCACAGAAASAPTSSAKAGSRMRAMIGMACPRGVARSLQQIRILLNRRGGCAALRAYAASRLANPAVG